MKNIKTIWKTMSDTKNIQSHDMIAYAILRAMQAKSENKRDIAKYYVHKAFTASKKSDTPYRSVITACGGLERRIRWQKTILGLQFEDIFDSEEELEMFKSLLESLKPYDLDRVYTYVFVRQDLAPEYQLVQAAHATMVLGSKLNKNHNPHTTYFSVIGVENLVDMKGTMLYLTSNGFSYEKFIEPDIGNEVTAIATHPIHWAKRKPLRDYDLLKFSS